MPTQWTWQTVPPTVRTYIEEQIGRVHKAEPAGHRADFAARLYGEIDNVFIKVTPIAGADAPLHQRELMVGQTLPPRAAAPRVLWHHTVDGHLVTAWPLLSDRTRWADLRPGSSDLRRVLPMVDHHGSVLTPCPAPVPLMTEYLAGIAGMARLMLQRPDLPDQRLFQEGMWLFDQGDSVQGETLQHCNLSPGHLLITGEQVHMVGWSRAMCAADWVTPTLLGIQLAEQGHTAAEADELMGSVTAWQGAPIQNVIGLTAVYTLFQLHRARYVTNGRRAPYVRIAEGGRMWLRYLLNAYLSDL